MSESETNQRPDEPPEGATPAELQADIEATRERLAASVEQLAAKADVPAQAKAKVQEASDRVSGAAQDTIKRAARISPTVWAAAAAAVTLLTVLLIWSRRRHRHLTSAPQRAVRRAKTS